MRMTEKITSSNPLSPGKRIFKNFLFKNEDAEEKVVNIEINGGGESSFIEEFT